jgi:hypothetical protein
VNLSQKTTLTTQATLNNILRRLALAEQESTSDLAQKSKCLATRHYASWTGVYSSKDLSRCRQQQTGKEHRTSGTDSPDIKNRALLLAELDYVLSFAITNFRVCNSEEYSTSCVRTANKSGLLLRKQNCKPIRLWKWLFDNATSSGKHVTWRRPYSSGSTEHWLFR